jgi:hypothetical protein
MVRGDSPLQRAVTFVLRLQTGRDGIHKTCRRLRGPVLIINLDKPYFRELLKVVGQQIRDRIRRARAVTGSFKIDVGDSVNQFKSTITGETVIKSNPAVGKAFRRARSFEVFVQQSLIHIVARQPADALSFKGWQVILITELAHKVEFGQHKLRRGSGLACTGGCARGRQSTCWSGRAGRCECTRPCRSPCDGGRTSSGRCTGRCGSARESRRSCNCWSA